MDLISDELRVEPHLKCQISIYVDFVVLYQHTALYSIVSKVQEGNDLEVKLPTRKLLSV